MAELQPSLLKETGALVKAKAPLCLFELTGKPRGKGDRDHRIVIPRDGRPPWAQFYLDEKTQIYMKSLAWVARRAMGNKPPSGQPLALTLHAFMPIYKSWPQRKRDDALIHAIRPTEKPDWDNMGKIMDALTGVVWNDDAPIVEAHVYKFYSTDPALRVAVHEFVPPSG